MGPLSLVQFRPDTVILLVAVSLWPRLDSTQEKDLGNNIMIPPLLDFFSVCSLVHLYQYLYVNLTLVSDCNHYNIIHEISLIS